MQRIAQIFLLAHGWRLWGLAAASGALSALALPPVGVFPVLALTLPALVWMLDGAVPDGARPRARLRPGLAIGFWFGFAYHLAGLWWIGRAFLVEADLFAWMMPFAVLLLPAGLALFTALGVGLAALLWRNDWVRLGLLAVALAGADWLRGVVLTGFPWNTFAHAVAGVPALMQPAALVGLYGLGLIVTLGFTALAGLADATRGGRRMAVAGLALLAVAAAGGALRLALAVSPPPQPVALRIVQPSIAQEDKWRPENRASVFATYLEMSAAGAVPVDAGGEAEGVAASPLRGSTAGADGPARLVIWPESAVPFLLTEAPDALAAIAALLGPRDALVTGAVRASADTQERTFYNSVFVIDGDGAVRDAYDKVRLVPFGEFLPFASVLERIGLTKLVALPGVFEAGFRHRTLSPPAGPSFLPLICYEAIFPQAATTRDPRPGWLLNVTNDAWFGDTPGPYQHFAQARLRAVEQGLPLVRAANTGISAVVDPYGRVLARLALWEKGVIDAPLPAAIAPTAYARFGSLAPALFYFGILGVLAVLGYLGNARRD